MESVMLKRFVILMLCMLITLSSVQILPVRAASNNKAQSEDEDTQPPTLDSDMALVPGSAKPDLPSSDQSRYFPFSSDILFSGSYQTFNFGFTVPKYWNTDYVYAKIEFSVSSMLSDLEVPASLTFSVNGTTVSTCQIDYKNGEDQVAYVQVPVELLEPGYNSLGITGFAAEYDENGCLDTMGGANWVKVLKSSTLQAGYSVTDIKNALNYYPYPFMSTMDEAGKNLSVYVPSNPSDNELSATLYIRANLGASVSGKTDSVSLETLDSLYTGQKRNRIIVAVRSKLPAEVSSHLSTGDSDLNKGAFIQEYSDSQGRVLVVTSDSDDALYDGAALLIDSSRISQETSDTAYVPAGTASAKINSDSASDTNDKYTFSQFVSSLSFTGINHQFRDIALPVTGKAYLGQGGKITLNFRYSKNLDFNNSMITVYWGTTPIGSKKLSTDNADGDVLSIDIPDDVVGTQVSSLRIAFDLVLLDDHCITTVQMPWAYVDGNSILYLPLGTGKALNFNSRPYPFVHSGSFEQTAVIIPDTLNSTELDTLGELFATFFSSADPYGKLTVKKASSLKSTSSYTNLFVLGTYSDNSFIQKINEKLSFSYSADGSGFLSNASLIFNKTYASTSGILQYIQSDNNSQNILVVSGASDTALQNINDYLRTIENRSSLSGDADLVDSDGEIRTYALLKTGTVGSDSSSSSGTAVQAIQNNIPDNEKSAAAGIALIVIGALLLIAVIALFIVLYRKNKNEKE